MRPFSGRSTLLAAIPWLGVAVLVSGCVQRAVVKSSPRQGRGSAREQVHLVMDVGSSGTALCMFPVRVSQDGRGCTVGSAPPVCSKAKGGLAAITQGQDPAESLGLVRPRLQAAWDARGDDSKGGRLALRAQGQAVAALGTGGVRDTPTGQTLPRTPLKRLGARLTVMLPARRATWARFLSFPRRTSAGSATRGSSRRKTTSSQTACAHCALTERSGSTTTTS